ncbi:tRNA (N(6)-L-threonylcarbamoyladenosine(37)-C(2))-methylthiotransferase MtaB [Serpentinicella alkaliphila]|uniref:Threonylcarbamoyladenosine tRNA methylthiotransferase MtaB n=1 Tax=Serpentinicella alkaliphila TaxID=1734049 RepID=A0A4R2U2V0_9FIRM|nr:tRNA (N(6)-L-threonylcarbamoyladenosine(37)-C(2))-methylthiotransferase MtaB [Serpentinicella alkaliphila]QUH26912.1 tRNA (N(6)-L-threonylcarbamoyladenosine(37)-C(2))-methylthiotransferase MtaB [Serpentinicella alkaliphila]TCQ08145.1 threonylcarbamoyladenosine tRNA methylthiotransferase MtaB [Serpentinicella alkaliphila]
MKKVAFHTLGCKVNQYETQAMSERFISNGYDIVDDTEAADVYVINTCTVTNVGDKKSRQFIRKVKRINPDAIIAVVGCYSQTAPEEVAKIEGVNIIIGTNDRNKIVDLVEECTVDDRINIVEDIMQVREFEEMSIQEIKDKTRAFLKIQEGCNQYCSYCIIPYARGNIRSRKKSEIINEIEKLVENGFKEIVLTGIHVASYGRDLKDDNTLINVLKEVNDIEGLERIRLSSLEPTLFTEYFLKELSKLNKVCDHFHLSLQSGSDTVLKRMNRKYTTDQYRNIVKIIRSVYPDVSLTTDIIVGFPGETDEEFNETYDFVKEMNFSMIHVFKFSPRKGTPAAEYADQIDGVTKHKRSVRLIKLGDEMQLEYMNKFFGKTLDVLFESSSKELEGYIEGTTNNYIKVLCSANENIEGRILKVELTEVKDSFMIGKIV